MFDEFAEYVVKLLEEERASRVHSLLMGGADLAAYKYGCGEIHGLDIAVAHIKAVQKKAEDVNDADD